MQEYVARLRHAVEGGSLRLMAVTDEAAAVRPQPDKWSPKEVIGHLVDSAANNHQRFVRAQLQPTLVFPGYAQEAWVEAQRYGDSPWTELVGLWRSYNLHIARVMEATPEATRLRPVSEHNFHQIAWRTVPVEQPVTLDYFMADYVDHLEHHLRQVLP